MKIGIIPAGGRSERWGGYPKEMLPVGREWSLLSRTILMQQRALTDKVIVVSSTEKLALHEWYIHEHKNWPNVSILTADSVMEAIQEVASRYDADFIFSMPDVFSDIPLFPEELSDPLVLGLFETEAPERFGMIRDGQIVDKQEGTPGQAWGAFMFNSDVAQFWVDGKFEDHTDMLNQAMKKFAWGSWGIEAYWDVASFEDYLKLLGGVYAQKHSTV